MKFIITPAVGKRLIAKAISQHNAVQDALKDGTIVIVAGTTNGYVADELLQAVGQSDGFHRQYFFRSATIPPATATTETGRLPDESRFPGDVVIVKGRWQKGKTIFDVVDDLMEGDVILKGANAVDFNKRQAGILIGHHKGGTTAVALQAVVGRRVRLILPVGLEKRVCSDLHELATHLNMPGSKGLRLFPVPGEVVTEIEAIALLTGAKADLVAAGGVCGAEGAVWLMVRGSSGEIEKAQDIISSVIDEPPFTF